MEHRHGQSTQRNGQGLSVCVAPNPCGQALRPKVMASERGALRRGFDEIARTGPQGGVSACAGVVRLATCCPPCEGTGTSLAEGFRQAPPALAP